MTKRIDPIEFGLTARTLLVQIDSNTIGIVMLRKSRIIMADGRKILEKAGKIKQVLPGSSVILRTSAPVCSKTLRFLEDEGIQVETVV
jgi:hypothetical protein